MNHWMILIPVIKFNIEIIRNYFIIERTLTKTIRFIQYIEQTEPSKKLFTTIRMDI